jgi:hypothetical protein
MRARLPLVVVSVLFGAAVLAAAPPEPDVDGAHRGLITATARVAVRVYSAVADFLPVDQRIALEIAEGALSAAAVGVDWTICGPGDCLTPAPGTLKIRIVESPPGSAPDPRRLGHALIHSRERTGELATVFIDRTRRLARELNIDPHVLLGRTIAHELGHLLLATATHAASGLMREVWSREELLGTRRADWMLDPLDAAAIRQRLTASPGARRPGAS